MKNHRYIYLLSFVLLTLFFIIKDLKISADSLIKQELRAHRSSYDHKSATQSIDDAWKNIRLGNSYQRMGNYTESAKAFERAYSINSGSRAVSGLKLAMAYEKLGKYQEGINLLDRMIESGELSENGIKNANEIKSRLLVYQTQSQ
jgi:tetratricopeptide (TPR) repeat protein